MAEAESAPAAVEAALEHRPDVCLLDINMPGGGIAAARRIAPLLPETRIVMLTVSEDTNDLFAALRAGASGYLLKGTPATRLPAALRGVMAGEAALPRVLVAKLVDAFRSTEAGASAPWNLSEREWDVLRLMRAGHTTGEIAELLRIAPVTVRTHVAAVMRKLRVKDRDAAIRSVER